MSVRATTWAWEQGRDGRVKDGKLLTLLRVADHADNDGICWPGEKSIAEFTGQGLSTVRGHLAAMEGIGLLHRERRSPEEGRRRATDRILLALESGGSDDGSTASSEGGLPPDSGGRTNKGTVKNRNQGRKEVNRKAVSESEFTLAAAVVRSFNEIAGTALRVDPHLTPIVGRIRERPELNGNHHRQIIEAVFAGDHWWKGAPGPRIIYGNAAQFEQSIELARAAAKKKSTPKFDVNAEMHRIRKEQGLED